MAVVVVLDLMILEMIQYLVKVVEVKVVINRLLLRILLEVTPLIIQAVVCLLYTSPSPRD